jgi:hypothetical protein
MIAVAEYKNIKTHCSVGRNASSGRRVRVEFLVILLNVVLKVSSTLSAYQIGSIITLEN